MNKITMGIFGRVVRDLERGHVYQTRAMAVKFGISQRTAQRWLNTIDSEVMGLKQIKTPDTLTGYSVNTWRKL